LGHNFFGLNDRSLYNRELFLLVYYGRFSYWEARFLPVNLRRYFIGEIVKEVKKQNGQDEKEERPLTEAEKGIYRGKLRQVQPERFREETNARWKSRDIRTMNFEGS
jgi:hypothetical protein